MSSIKEETREMFKNKQPYRTVKISEAERIANYLATKYSMSQEVDQQLANDPQIGQTYRSYNQNMESLITRGYKQ